MDFGIDTSYQLIHSRHITSISAKALQRAVIIHHRFYSRNLTLLRQEFVINIKPLLQYASSDWSPYTINVGIANLTSLKLVLRNFNQLWLLDLWYACSKGPVAQPGDLGVAPSSPQNKQQKMRERKRPGYNIVYIYIYIYIWILLCKTWSSF